MPVLTSLYLCNRTVYAAVGSPTANGAKITAACQTELPEGCLINGIITNEAELAAACGLKLYSIDLALAGQIKLVRATPELAGKSFVMLQFDGDSLIAGLYEKGQYKYSTRSRLFNPRGTEASGAEIGQKLSGLIQFQTAAKSEHPIKAVYFGGSTAADLAVCTPACRALQLEVAAYPETENIKLPEGIRLADIALAAGNLIGR